MKTNCITFSSIVKLNLGNPNSGYNEDIISTIKKIQFPNGDSYPYISGQSIRRMARERLKDFGFESSPRGKSTGKEKSPKITSCDPEKYADDDLFGYMDATNLLSRTSPVRVSPAVALFPYNYERDLGLQNNSDIHQSHSMYETEVSSNWLTYSVLIELDRVGRGESEIKKGNAKSDWEISNEERFKRIEALLNSFLYLWGGGKQSRFMTNEKPLAIVISVQNVKNPIWLGRIHLDNNGNLDDETIINIIKENSSIMVHHDVGIESPEIRSKEFSKTPKAAINGVIEEIKGKI